MNRILLFQVVIVFSGAILLWVLKVPEGIASFAAGGALIAANFVLLGSVLKFIFKKKLIALMVLVIVFKYAILGIIIYLLVKQSWLIPFWFAAGVSSMMFGSLIYGLTLGFFKEE